MAKSEVLSMRLAPVQKAWLEAREAETGLTAADTIKALIAAAMAMPAEAMQQPTRVTVQEIHARDADRRAQIEEATRREEEARRKAAEREAKAQRLRDQLEALERGEDIDDALATDADQSQLYAGEDESSDQIEEDDAVPFDEVEAPRDRGNVSTLKTGAFSLTRPVGLAADMTGGSQPGQARQNIVRENFAFLSQTPRRR